MHHGRRDTDVSGIHREQQAESGYTMRTTGTVCCRIRQKIWRKAADSNDPVYAENAAVPGSRAVCPQKYRRNVRKNIRNRPEKKNPEAYRFLPVRSGDRIIWQKELQSEKGGNAGTVLYIVRIMRYAYCYGRADKSDRHGLSGMDEPPGNHGKELYNGNEGPAGVENAKKPEKSRGEKAFPRAVQTRRTDSGSDPAPDPAARADL